jgi:two-component system nitrogen regulation response regulator NtrX
MTTTPAVLVVDDDGDIRAALELMLQYEGYTVWTARDGEEALARLDKEARAGLRPAAVLTDVKMPRLDGLGLLAALQARAAAPPVLMISGHGDIAMAVDAIKRGACDFLEKPLDQNRVLVSLQHALRERRLESENSGLRRQLGDRWRIVGVSAAMSALREHVERVALSGASVLLTGENGTGKEVVARAIHLSSPRAAAPFVTVNCAAIPAELIESELFGHEKGSFTGAERQRIGHFESAHGGTLFLDEVGDMPLAAQAKVLRALETREVTRVGGTTPIQVDIRVIAATNADLMAAIEQKAFRLDLFYRLNVVPLRVPALRERREDVAPLAEHFLATLAERSGGVKHALDPDAAAYLAAQDWPGNARQLRNVLEAACVFASGPLITRADIEQVLANGQGRGSSSGAPAADDPFAAETFEVFKDRSEALYFQRKLLENGGNIKRTAERLGMQRSHLYKKLDRYQLR